MRNFVKSCVTYLSARKNVSKLKAKIASECQIHRQEHYQMHQDYKLRLAQTRLRICDFTKPTDCNYQHDCYDVEKYFLHCITNTVLALNWRLPMSMFDSNVLLKTQQTAMIVE